MAESRELRDLRAKITVETDAVLDAIARVTGKDRSELVRDWLHEKAQEHIEICNVLCSRLKAEGISASCEGASGSDRE